MTTLVYRSSVHRILLCLKSYNFLSSLLWLCISCLNISKYWFATTYFNINEQNRRLEIGYTWYRSSVQRGPINTQAKRLLLTHAFETLNCVGVEFRTHFMNHQSRRAIERLGAKLDGILRSNRIMPDGSLRDTCVYSIIAPEWPTIRAHLDHKAGHRLWCIIYQTVMCR